MENPGTVDTPVIACRDVAKTFATQKTSLEVLRNLSLEVRDNEFVVLLGPGQCGKTTLVNMIAGLEKTTAGSILYRGQPISGPNPRLGVVYQTTALFPWFTVMKNVDFGPRMKRMSRIQRLERAQYFINLVGLQGFENAYPVKLSGGMRQRVGIARAYANDPDVMLMDEPFGHLDAQTRYSMQEALERIWSKERRTVVFITNNIEEAIYLADRIILLTNCPTSVKKEVIIDLPRPRDYVSREFLDIREQISSIVEVTK
ncbi:MAG: ABC transporter ATP-binding protein [Planctomycetaceae bacterium]|nr:ABC transporter ATP-binding protein [Planctomycetaceae bacterium]